MLEKKLKSLLRAPRDLAMYPTNSGYCVICEQKTVFIKYEKWLRDNYLCRRCRSIPRNRALVNALNVFYPDWKICSMHESSPGGTLSDYLRNSNKGYTSSHYFDGVRRGEYKDGVRSEDLSSLTFEDDAFDLFITSDVFEHVMEPAKAFSEIARVLKKNGAHVFTMPWYPELQKTTQRAKLEDGKIINLADPVYHGNPISGEGSLVTYDWGRDFVNYIFKSSGLHTTIYLAKDKFLGLEAEFLEVFISVKE